MGEDLIAHIIIRFNKIESQIKDIIATYINSEQEDFVNNFLLNNLVINFSNKYKLLRAIAKKNNIEIDKKFNNGIHILSSIRNAVAHSDQLSNISIIDAEMESDGLQIPIYGLDPDIIMLQNDEIVKERLLDKEKIFNKYYELIIIELEKIEKQIITKK